MSTEKRSDVKITRREVLSEMCKALVPLTVGLPATRKILAQVATGAPQVLASRIAGARKLKVMVTGGHPGDPECGCGGTIACYTDAGHDVLLMYLNRGQAYCGPDSAGKDCGAVRTAEAKKACEILKGRFAFAGQYDGRAVVDAAHYDEFRKLFAAEMPDVVLAQWPIDRHRDHRALSNLVLDAWFESGKKSVFYYYGIAEDTMMFNATEYVDITATEPRKRAACFSHASQQPDKWYPLEEQLTRFRGAESGHAQAEGFLRHWESKFGLLP
jgi:N-acetylglucosamine malate deacetylase 1